MSTDTLPQETKKGAAKGKRGKKEKPRPKGTLGAAIKAAMEGKGQTNSGIAKVLGVTYDSFNNMIYNPARKIQRDLALKLARVLNVDPGVFEPYLSTRAPAGSRKKRVVRALRKEAETWEVSCPHCQGEGTIRVRKV